MADRPSLVVCNPYASRLADPGRRARLRTAIEGALQRRDGVAPDWLEGSQAAAQAALADLDGRPMVVIAGGEGTVRDAAAAVQGTGVPLAIAPGGTGNVLAAAMGIGSLETAVGAIRHGAIRTIDLGRARWADPAGEPVERLFTVAAGMGFDARVMAAADQSLKHRFRFAAYVGAALFEATRLEPAEFHIEADGRAFEMRGLVVLIANCGDLVPGKLGARRPIDPTDGRLDLLVVGGHHVIAGLRGVVELLWQTGDLDGAVLRRGVEHVRVEATPAQPIQVDGDPDQPSWLEAHVVPGALRLVVPGTPGG